MRRVRPRALVHRGVVQAAGFIVEVELLGLTAARERVLSAWRPGAAVERLGSWLLLLPPAPVQVEASRAPGIPLVRESGALLAAPFAGDELDVLEPVRDAVVAVRGGVARVYPPSERVPEEPAGWLDVGAFEVAKVESLGALPAAPALVAVAPPVHVLRERLSGTIPPPPSEVEQVLAALEKARQAPGRVEARKPGLWTRLLEWLAGRGPPAPAPPPSSALARPSRPRGPSYLDRLKERVQRLAARLLQLSRLAALIGRAQAEYLGRMMDMFERGELEQALRHAIPLASESGPRQAARPALGVPSPRKDLSISPRRDGGASALGVGPDLMGELKQLYRQAFERLKRQGRIDEAAFVLAELLQANEEAVAFLEEHGKLKLAAEVAEARGLPASQVVRLWFQAGDVERAVWIARRTGAFADAVSRLERIDPEKARALRLIWADTLAQAGNYAAAVEAIWPVEEGRRLARAWLDRVIELGGAAGAQAMVRKVILDPSAFPEVRERAVVVLEDDALEGARERRAFAEALLRGTGPAEPPELRTLARPAVRAMVRDRVQHGQGLPSGELERLVAFSKDGALRTDMPPLPPAGGWRGGDSAVPELTIDAHDSGALKLLEAVALPGGRTLVALGESGARLITRDGRTVHHFDVPAHRLVVSDHGDRAIALAPRGEAVELWRLDLLQRRATRWCTARVDAHAPDFDGSLWFVSAGDTVFAVDAMTPGDFKALWRVDRVGGPVLAIARSERQCHFVVDGRPPERWTLELPALVLRSRSLLAVPSLDPRSCDWRIGQSPWGATGLVQQLQPTVRIQAVVHEGTRAKELAFPAEGVPRAPALSAGWLAVPVARPRGVEILGLDLKTGGVAACFRLVGALSAAVRLQGALLTVADDHGRLLVFDVEQKHLLRDLRL